MYFLIHTQVFVLVMITEIPSKHGAMCNLLVDKLVR
jgi:hypothetical protein